MSCTPSYTSSNKVLKIYYLYKGADACDIKCKVLVVHVYTLLLLLYTVSKKLFLSYTVMHVKNN